MNPAPATDGAFARGLEPAWCANYVGLPFKSLGRTRAGSNTGREG